MSESFGSKLAVPLLLSIFVFCGWQPVRPQPAKALPTAKFALLVGITDYPDGLNKIDGCVNNVPLLADTLVADYGFNDKNVVRLMDKDAKRDDILAKFKSHLIEGARANRNAVIVFYFCGHGSQYPDQDGDEKSDGLDETLVAYDSRSPGKFDILDDEIDDLKAELRQYTKNATFIIESCHSGTGTRAAEYVAEEADNDKRARAPYKRKFPATQAEDTNSYVEIDASLSSRAALSETAEFCGCDKPHSLMTKALVEALKRSTSSTTYLGLTGEIADEVSRFSQQEPQVEGDRYRRLFGGAAERSEPYIRVSAVKSDGSIEIAAGSIQGLKEGSQIAFYSSVSKTNLGKDGWLENGVVMAVGPARSVVSLPAGAKASTIKITSHAILASPVFGGGPVLVALSDNQRKDLGDVTVRAGIEKRLRDDGLIDNQLIKLGGESTLSALDRKSAKSVIRLRKAKVSDIFRDNSQIDPLKAAMFCEAGAVKKRTAVDLYPSPDAEVFYLDNGTDAAPPLFGMTFDPHSDTLAQDISRAIRRIAFQQNLRGLNNAASSLISSVRVKFEAAPTDALIPKCNADGEVYWDKNGSKYSGFVPVKNTLPIDQLARITVENISGEIRRKTDPHSTGEPLFISIIDVRPDGVIKVFSGIGQDDAIADGKSKPIGVVGSYPVGVEHFFVIVSREFVDLSFYESGNVSNKDGLSPLETILSQSGIASRDRRSILGEPDSWGVIRLDVSIGGDVKVNTPIRSTRQK